jgi:diacylglycerol kinase family enzyme
MDVLLIHNPGAGARGSHASDVERAIRDGGHRVRSVSCRDAGWDAALAQPADVVAVWGGDGTVGRVAQRMIGRGVPLAAMAAGTANNIALTLGVEALSVEDHVRGWHNASRRAFDVAIATGPWGREPLIEGLGCGLLASSIRGDDGDDGRIRQLEPQQRLARALQVLKERVSAFPTTHVRATIDGRDISGDYVLFEIMNTQFIGPNLYLAPQGRADDGMLDAVFVAHGDRARLRDQLASWQRGAIATSQPLDSARGAEVTIVWTGFALHLDDRLWPQHEAAQQGGEATIEIRVERSALEFLVP